MTDIENDGLGTVSVEARGPILMIGLNRPEKYNSLTIKMVRLLSEAYEKYESNDNYRCAILFGHGKVFCAGADLASLKKVIETGEMHFAQDQYDPYGITGKRLSKPLIVAVHGVCFAGGLEVSLSGDMIVAASGTKFGQQEVQRGLFAFAGGAFRWVERVGWGNAQRYLLTGDTLDADEARRIGLVQEVVEPDQVLPRAIELAGKVAAAGPLGIRGSLACSRQALTEGAAAATAALVATQLRIMKTADAAEGLTSFIEKRAGNYTGK